MEGGEMTGENGKGKGGGPRIWPPRLILIPKLDACCIVHWRSNTASSYLRQSSGSDTMYTSSNVPLGELGVVVVTIEAAIQMVRPPVCEIFTPDISACQFHRSATTRRDRLDKTITHADERAPPSAPCLFRE